MTSFGPDLWQVRLLTTWGDEPQARIIPLLARDTWAISRKYASVTMIAGMVSWKCLWERAFDEWWRLAKMDCYDEARIDTGI